MNTRKRYYRRSTNKKYSWKYRKKRYRTHAKQYRTHAMKKPILGDGYWDDRFKFERKWGVMRRGRGWPKH